MTDARTLWIVSGGAEAVPGIQRAKAMGLHVVVSDMNPGAPGFAHGAGHGGFHGGPAGGSHGGGDHHDTKVIHKTVIVHDHDNIPLNIIITQNTQGTCFITQTQIVSIPNIVQQLLDQCTTVTIT